MFEIIRGLCNPTVILALLLVWSGTSVYHGVTEWVNQRKVVRPFVDALIERDKAAVFKDQLIEAVAKDKEGADAELEKMRAQLDQAERERSQHVKTPECTWTDYDVRVLNRAGAGRRN